jgi:hypothetical protein
MGSRPYLSDEHFIHIASFLDVVSLGRLSCVATRFTLRAVFLADDEPGEREGGHERWSVPEEGSRRQLVRFEKWQQGMAPRLGGSSWMRTLHEVQMLAAPRRFTAASSHVRLTEDGELLAGSTATVPLN